MCVREARRVEPAEQGARVGHAPQVLPEELTPPDAAALPAAVRLAPHLTVLAVGPATRVVGLDPASALLVEDLVPALARMVDTLADPVAPATAVATAARHGAHPDQAAALLRRLWRAGALVDAVAEGRRTRLRAVSVALVVGDGPLAVGIATGLALAGVGAVHVDASGVVQAGDLGTGHADADRGRPRGPAIAAAVRRVAPTARTGPLPQRSRPDIAVLADAIVPDPARVAALVAAGTPHLAVHLRDGAGVVGPLVLPGRSPCLRCLALHRGTADPGWPHVAARLAGRAGRASPASVAATAALGTAQALAALDTGAEAPPPALGATLTLDSARATVVRRPFPAHSHCPCRAPHEPGGPDAGRGASDTPCESPSRRETI